MEKNIIKTYGVMKTSTGRYAIVTDITDKGRYYTLHHSLSYAKKEFAIQKARNYLMACFKPFTNFQGDKITFTFENCGVIESNN